MSVMCEECYSTYGVKDECRGKTTENRKFVAISVADRVVAAIADDGTAWVRYGGQSWDQLILPKRITAHTGSQHNK